MLKLDSAPCIEDNFFDLGGDSLASAELIIDVEEKFSCQIPVEEFLHSPTVATLDRLVKQRAASLQRAGVLESDRVLHKLQILTANWNGKRRFPEALIIGLNDSGARAPIFWVFQEPFEFAQLAKHLGPDQPLYGMRSCVGIVRPKDYSTVMDSVCTRYFLEMLSIGVADPLVVGGNCQGAILSLELAKRFSKIGISPSLLILTEWSYSYGRYLNPTLLLYGDESHTADIYRQERPKIDWQNDFPLSAVAPVPGRYGELFADGNIPEFAEVLRRHLSQFASSGRRDKLRTRARKIAGGASAWLNEIWSNGKIKELEIKLASREAEIGELRANLPDRKSKRSGSSKDIRSNDYTLLNGPDGVDRNWYLKNNPDVATARVDPIVHYLAYGWREGRDPRADFSTTGYLDANQDVARAGCNPLVHYIRWGRAEGRPLGVPPPSMGGSSP